MSRVILKGQKAEQSLVRNKLENLHDALTTSGETDCRSVVLLGKFE